MKRMRKQSEKKPKPIHQDPIQQDNRTKKDVPRKLRRSTADLLPITDYNEDQAFVTKSGEIIDFLAIQSKDLNSMKDYDLEFDIARFIKIYRTYAGDLKIITLECPLDTTTQISYINRLVHKTQNPICNEDLEREKEALAFIKNEKHVREFFLMFFSKNKREHKENMLWLKASAKDLLSPIALEKKVQILYKICNFNNNIAMHQSGEIPRGIPKGHLVNPYLLHAIAPQGNISFRDEYCVKTGSGFQACIHVYDYVSEVHFNWLSDICLFEDSICTVDIGTADKSAVIKNISSSMEEQLQRYHDSRHRTDQIKAQEILLQLDQVFKSLNSMGEIIKRIHVRIFVYAPTQDALEKKASEVITDIENRGYKAGVFLDENKLEWLSLFQSYTRQNLNVNARKGKALPTEALAIGHPYHFSSLQDPYGFYLGYTNSGGSVIYDHWHKDPLRLSYCSVIVGSMGGGKSTTLKKMIKSDIIKGNVIRAFVVNKEFNRLAERYGGTIINLDGTDGFLNIFQVYQTSEIEAQSFLKHISKITTFFSFLIPEMAQDTTLKDVLQRLTKRLYEQHMGYAEDCSVPITGRPPTAYPIASDFLHVIRQAMYADYPNRIRHDHLSEAIFSKLETLEYKTENLVTVFGRIFNGHSSIRDFSKQQFVLFNIEDLKSGDPTVFDAQIFNALYLLWDNLMQIGGKMKERYDNRDIPFDMITRYMIYMDEAHNFINSRKINAVEFVGSYERESRKFFGGIVMASPTIRDFFPENSTQFGVDAIKSLFSLAQYKFIFKQDQECQALLRKAFGGEMPENDLEDIPKFEVGECAMIISGNCSYRIHIEVSKQELALFSGGA